ncbi:hypothetical protein EB825_19760 [Vibrio cholerae]|nr:hypothetical protein [Vibrio cholerae]
MAANQELHKAMLLREFATHDAIGNFVRLDNNIPHEAASCSGQLKLATVLEFSQYNRSDSLGVRPPLY